MNFIDNPTKTIEIAPANTITFTILGEPVLLLDKDGFTYLGERIADAGKNIEITNEEIKECMRSVKLEGGDLHGFARAILRKAQEK